jgi:hypothetical protein
VIEETISRLGSIHLPVTLRNRPITSGAIDRHRRPSAAILVGHMDKQRMLIVLDPDPMAGLSFFLQPADRPAPRKSADE